ncbi:MAG: peptide chain release factor N(5)-glutamine methyltransferase [Phycisphaerae bacterium]
MEASGTQAGPWTVARLLGWTRDFLERRRLESPRLCAEILLAHAMGCERIQLHARWDTTPESGAVDRFRELVKRAADGAPIAYLTGAKEFFSLTFEVTPDVLIPRPETEILVERVIHLARRPDAGLQRVLDLGTGSGCIAIALARHLPGVAVCASDVSAAALAVAKRNAERHQLADRIEFRAGDLFAAWDEQRFDVIVSNPPYVATTAAGSLPRHVRDYEPTGALFAGEDGLAVIRRIVADAPQRLNAGGWLLLEIAYDQAAALRALLAAPSWAEVVLHRDGGGHERVAQARCGAAR